MNIKVLQYRFIYGIPLTPYELVYLHRYVDDFIAERVGIAIIDQLQKGNSAIMAVREKKELLQDEEYNE